MPIMVDTGKTQGIIDLEKKKFPAWFPVWEEMTYAEIESYCKRKGWIITQIDAGPPDDCIYYE